MDLCHREIEIPTEKSEMAKCIYDIYETNHELPRVKVDVGRCL